MTAIGTVRSYSGTYVVPYQLGTIPGTWLGGTTWEPGAVAGRAGIKGAGSPVAWSRARRGRSSRRTGAPEGGPPGAHIYLLRCALSSSGPAGRGVHRREGCLTYRRLCRQAGTVQRGYWRNRLAMGTTGKRPESAADGRRKAEGVPAVGIQTARIAADVSGVTTVAAEVNDCEDIVLAAPAQRAALEPRQGKDGVRSVASARNEVLAFARNIHALAFGVLLRPAPWWSRHR